MPEQPILVFKSPKDWELWLEKNHAASDGVWLRIARKGAGISSVMHPEALDVALCYGWIDGQSKSEDDQFWLRKFTPRGKKSIWSKVNRLKVKELIAAGRMRPAGLLEIERAKQDGRWEAAYDSPKSAAVPEDFQKALNKNAKAKAFFETLNGANRYAFLFRIQTAKRPETRAARIEKFVQMLKNGEVFYP